MTASEMPEIEVIDGWINRGISDLMLYTPQTLKELKLRFSLKLFIFKRQSGILTLPIHRCKVLLVSNNEVLVTWQGPDLTFSSESTKNIEIMPDEVSIFGPGVLKFYTEVDASYLADPPLKLRMSITLDFAETNKHINMDIPFVYSRTSGTTDSGNTYRPLLHRYVLE
ncbi:MAG: hypothetical protein U5L04_06995 [Trueperaceae bacterium]|nr:hypothetical protein [Trueperaceae bacterium]